MKLNKIVEDIKREINSEEVKNRIASDLNINLKSNKCKCFIHKSNSDTVMSFDKEAKRFKCFSCSQSYDIFNHYQEHYNLNFVDCVKAIIKDFSLNIELLIDKSERKAKKAPTKHNSYNEKVLSYCNKRRISKSTVDYVGVKENEGNVVFEYRNELGEHIANKYRFTSKTAKVKMMFEKDTNINTLFNMDKINISEPLVITEGEFDCLAVIEAGYKNAVSIPSGVNSTNKWIETNWTFLEQFEEIILWFDNDEAGLKGVREASSRLTNNIVKIVKCTIANDINELLAKEGKQSVLDHIKKASVPLVEGVATFDMIEDFDIYEAEKLELGIRKMDHDILGMVFGSLNILSGRNGAGKSTILNQIYLGEAIRQGYKCFLFSGELVAGNVKEWLIRTLANEEDLVTYTSKNNMNYKRVSIESRKKIVNNIKDKIYLYDTDDYNIDSILVKMKQLATRLGAKVFVIDNLMVIESNVKEELKAQSEVVKKLKNFAKKYNAIVHLVAHPRKSINEEITKDDVAGTANITNLADYVTTIERNFKEDREYDAKLSILKNRHTGINTCTTLKFDSDRKRFYSSSEKLELGVNYLDSKQEFIEVQEEF